jgi:hypothetical protein
MCFFILLGFACKTKNEQKIQADLKKNEDTIKAKKSITPDFSEPKYDSSYYSFINKLIKQDKFIFDTTFKPRQISILNKQSGISRVVCNCDSFLIQCIDSNRVDYFKSYLEIDNRLFDLQQYKFENSTFQRDNLENIDYGIWCSTIKKFKLASQNYYLIPAGFRMCNGSGCAQNFYFLYNQTFKKLSVFANFRWGGYFGDINQDNVLDYVDATYQGDWVAPDSVKIEAYTQLSNGHFTKMRDKQGNPYFIILTFEGIVSPMNTKNTRIAQSYWMDSLHN